MKVYKTRLDAEKELHLARLELSHGGEQEVYVEHHQLGYLIAEFKIFDGIPKFQRYYNGE